MPRTLTAEGLTAILEQAGLVYFDSDEQHHECGVREGCSCDDEIAAAVPAINAFFNDEATDAE